MRLYPKGSWFGGPDPKKFWGERQERKTEALAPHRELTLADVLEENKRLKAMLRLCRGLIPRHYTKHIAEIEALTACEQSAPEKEAR